MVFCTLLIPNRADVDALTLELPPHSTSSVPLIWRPEFMSLLVGDAWLTSSLTFPDASDIACQHQKKIFEVMQSLLLYFLNFFLRGTEIGLVDGWISLEACWNNDRKPICCCDYLCAPIGFILSYSSIMVPGMEMSVGWVSPSGPEWNVISSQF